MAWERSAMLEEVPKAKGVYILVLELRKPFLGRVGSLGMIKLEPGTYLYVGSARGPGGFRARIGRHVSKEKRVRWHVDYLTTFEGVEPVAVVFAETENDAEAVLSAELMSMGMKPAVKGFGCSDKRSYTHLLKCSSARSVCIDACIEAFRRLGLEPKVVEL